MRSVRLLAALALALTGSLTAASSDAAAPLLGDLTVTMVDAAGDPTPGSIQVTGGSAESGGFAQASSTHTFSLPEGAYGVVGVTPWGGLACAGMTACNYIAVVSGQATPNGDLVVVPGAPQTVTLEAEPTAVVGGKRVVGSKLTVDYSPGMDEMLTIFGTTVLGALPTITWLRDGTAIPGATEPTYVPTGKDTGRAIAARLEYTGLGLSYMQQISGQPSIPSFTTPAVTVGKKSAQTFVRMVRSEISARQRGVVRVDVTSPNAIVTGKVKVTVGRWSDTRPLRNGRVAFQLPALEPGKYAVHASYLGSGEYKPSDAKPKTLTVTP